MTKQKNDIFYESKKLSKFIIRSIFAACLPNNAHSIELVELDLRRAQTVFPPNSRSKNELETQSGKYVAYASTQRA